MDRTGWVAAGLLVVAGVASWLTLPPAPKEAEPEADVDGAFEASVKEPQPAHAAGHDANLVLLARADHVAARQELDQRFETDPHDDAAPRVESAVQAAFAHDDVSAELFKSVACRKTICKLSVRMSKARVGGYNHAMHALQQAGFSGEPNAERLFDQRRDPGEIDVDMYLSHTGVQTPQP